MDAHINPQIELAHNFVEYTNQHVFLTGKAGTGKTTFLHSIKLKSPKRMVVVAPTGVAAINAGGVTIHSFFQLPFSPYIPNAKTTGEVHKLNNEKIRIIKSLDLLVIDEISMVRADLLDQVDEVLRRFRDKTKPFGGVQLLMIGDLHQLPPIVKDEEWDILKKYYSTAFFFGSRALQQTDYVSIELKHIYRQSDQRFISLLNKVRDNNIDDETLKELNKRYQPNISQTNSEGYITLTTHNYQAQNINQTKLAAINDKEYIYKAVIVGDFPPYMFPTESELILKLNAQVMFIKNDSSPAKLYYNGKIGVITEISNESILVRCKGDYEDISVNLETWENTKYSIDENTKEIKQNVSGSFKQIPLKLAWAITIHKSQGLTFEKAIIDAQSAFAFGQVYVALSRCKTLEGMVLSTPISRSGIKDDENVFSFTAKIEQNQPDEKTLNDSKLEYQKTMLIELFDFKFIGFKVFAVHKLFDDNHSIFNVKILNDFSQMKTNFQVEISDVAEKFKNQITTIINQNKLVEENDPLQERIKKAANYFLDKLEIHVTKLLSETIVETDNKAVKKSIIEALDLLHDETFIKMSCLKICLDKFDVKKYLETKAKSTLNIPKRSAIQTVDVKSFAKLSNHPILYAQIKAWRLEKAQEADTDEYMILNQKTLVQIVNDLPQTTFDLQKIKGIGKQKVKQFGYEIVTMVQNYCKENNIKIEQTKQPIEEPVKKEKTPDSKAQSFELFVSGKTIEKVAKERSFSVSTIEGHLAHYVGTGELDVNLLVNQVKLNTIVKYFTENVESRLAEAKQALGDAVSWSELKYVQKYLEHIRKNETANL